jgi:3-deoxy-manno-octulosonate cytidylyltransferase (CMP-KDO synthetase)
MANADNHADVIVVIPARYESSRFPGKPLTRIAGKPMIQHVYDRVRQAQGVSKVLVAADDERILQAVKDFGGEAIPTRRDHRTGTERVAEAALRHPAAIYVNVQGDEPLIDPRTIEGLIDAMQSGDAVDVATASAAITDPAEIIDVNINKVVMDFDGNALYFSHAPIPWVRDTKAPVAAHHWKHIGIYGYRREALLEYPTMPPGELERLEQLEQLRWLENGYRIRVVETEYNPVSVDVPADVARVEELLKARAASSQV